MIHNIVVINRAVPGSGKTTISKSIVRYFEERDIAVDLHSTDDYFMRGGRYDFNIMDLYGYHMLNLEGFRSSLQSGTPIVICDNINIAPWQTEPYTILARQYKYRVIFINFLPRELEKHIESQKITPERPDAHAVPEDILKRFIKEFKIYNVLLDKTAAVDPKIHKHYEWDNKHNIRIESGLPCKHFDADFIITILPQDYHSIKEKIGEKVHKML